MSDYTREEVVAKVAAGESLEGADLEGVDLQGADLRGTGLRKAELRGTDLRKTRLDVANLYDSTYTKGHFAIPNTIFPPGFDPNEFGMVNQADKDKHLQNQGTRSIPLKVRHQVFRNAGRRCQQCGKSAVDGVTLEVDHIMPVSHGGSDDISNLQLLCFDCNRGKSDTI